jgi:hypothetical protein
LLGDSCYTLGVPEGALSDMAERQTGLGLLARCDQPLLGVIFQENGEEVVRYFADEAAADAALPPSAIQEALSVIGAWSDFDWDDMEAALDRIRHESTPTPPMGL